MSVVDDLLARLRTISGVAHVYDTDADRYIAQAAPALILQNISGVGATTIEGSIHTVEERWQVSVRGTNLAKVRAIAQDVRDSLHGYRSDSIKYCAWESSPGVIREDGQTVEYHAPVDFMVTT
jgi:hypothetical protein